MILTDPLSGQGTTSVPRATSPTPEGAESKGELFFNAWFNGTSEDAPQHDLPAILPEIDTTADGEVGEVDPDLAASPNPDPRMFTDMGPRPDEDTVSDGADFHPPMSDKPSVDHGLDQNVDRRNAMGMIAVADSHTVAQLSVGPHAPQAMPISDPKPTTPERARASVAVGGPLQHTQIPVPDASLTQRPPTEGAATGLPDRAGMQPEIPTGSLQAPRLTRLLDLQGVLGEAGAARVDDGFEPPTSAPISHPLTTRAAVQLSAATTPPAPPFQAVPPFQQVGDLVAQLSDAATRDAQADPIADEVVITTSHSPTASSQAAAPAMSRVSANPVAQQLAAALSHAQGTSTRIALNPEELGIVRISLTSGEAGLTVNIFAERPETTDLLRRNIDSLLQEFSQMGYDNPSFSFGEDSNDQDKAPTPQDMPLGDADTAPLPVTLTHRMPPTGGLDLIL